MHWNPTPDRCFYRCLILAGLVYSLFARTWDIWHLLESAAADESWACEKLVLALSRLQKSSLIVNLQILYHSILSIVHRWLKVFLGNIKTIKIPRLASKRLVGCLERKKLVYTVKLYFLWFSQTNIIDIIKVIVSFWSLRIKWTCLHLTYNSLTNAVIFWINGILTASNVW